MAYSCECPQYKVVSASEQKDLIGQELDVLYSELSTKGVTQSKVNKAIVCYDFYFTGKLKKIRAFNKIFFEASEAVAKLRFKDCVSGS